jgi:hypothetical protein
MKITKRQLKQIIKEELFSMEEGDYAEHVEGEGDSNDPTIVAIRKVEALRPLIETGDVGGALSLLDQLWEHLREMSPVPTSNVPMG